MTLAAGTRLGPYEIQSAIGAGGMGEVYRARDTKLGRDIAIKVLPASLTNDPERLARFTREAQVLASLNHPNIAAIHHVEETSDGPALVMELVEGEDLSQRIARGPIPVDEALPIASQMAEALEAAHEQGIIHRDLKPANIKVRPDGTVKVLDFGLAKLTESNAVAGSVSNALSQSPTITSPAMMTAVGVLLGTAAYMSPEQARGKAADRRSDIWAFGCVLFEMLTGKRAFDGEDVAETLAAILMREPDWNTLPSTTAPAIRTLLKGCLEKNRHDRFGDIAAPVFLMSERASLVATPTSSGSVAVRRDPHWQRLVPLAIGVVFGSAIVSAVWFAIRPATTRVSRLAVTSDESQVFTINGGASNVAITADGSRIVYVGNKGSELFVRPLDGLEAVSIFKGAPRGPFVSPDGQWVGFFDGTSVLKRVAITGGPAITVATLDGASRGATWPSGDIIVFATAAANTGLQQVSVEGGPVTVLTRPDRGRGDADHFWPELLPGGRAVLFTIVPFKGGADAAQVAVLDLKTGTQKIVVRGGSNAHYVSSGHLVYAAAKTLRAVGFDPVGLETQGTPVPVVPEVLTTTPPAVGGVDAAVASDGTLTYIRGVDVGAFARLTPSWIDREGRETTLGAPPRTYSHPRVSPDGERVALWANDQDSDVWIWDIRRSTLTRLTFTPGIDNFPVLTPDGQRLIFASERDGIRNLFSLAADGTGTADRLTRSPNFEVSTGVTPDGRRAIFTETSPGTLDDIMEVDLNGNHQVVALVQSPFMERNGIVSPDGRWLAYEANDSGQFEIYVRPYPEVNSGHWQVSSGGGTQPRWSHNAEELFYAAPVGAVRRVGVQRGSSWSPTTPTVILTTPTNILRDAYIPGDAIAIGGSTYDVSPDGKRFLVFKAATDAKVAPAPQIVVVQHFDQELKRLAPTK
jgi:serine/threonine protein kinase